MATRLEMFKKEMEPAKEIYTKEIKDFAKNYDFLGKMTLKEEPDIDTQDYIFCFEKLNGTHEDVLDQTLREFYSHMDEFSKAKKLKNLHKTQVSGYRRHHMNIEKFPQYQLHLLTLRRSMLKDMLVPENCDEWCVNASIINRAYYSSYLYCELWLDYMKKFKIKHPWEFDDNERRIGEHKQVRKALSDFGEKNMKTELEKLFFLRKKLIMNLSQTLHLTKSQKPYTTWKKYSIT